SAMGSSVKDWIRTSPLMPWAAPMRPTSSSFAVAPPAATGLLGRGVFGRSLGRGGGSGGPVGLGLGTGLGALLRLLARLGLERVVARRARQQAGGIAEAGDAVG